MNADSDYQIGKEHIVCEDYALAGVGVGGDSAFAIVCDGCSASKDVDFGARTLALSARETLKKIDTMSLGGESQYEDFGIQTIRRADMIFPLFPQLHPQALDATLLIAWVKNGKLTAYIYGDGVFFLKGKTLLQTIHVEFEPGAPAYLSYNLDPARKRLYDAENIVKNKEDSFRESDGTKGFTTKLKPFDPIVLQLPVEDGDIIGVASDGINSFRKSDGTPIPWYDLVDDYIGYKNYEGEFVKRRMGAFKRKCLKEGITHYDDISISSIVV